MTPIQSTLLQIKYSLIKKGWDIVFLYISYLTWLHHTSNHMTCLPNVALSLKNALRLYARVT